LIHPRSPLPLDPSVRGLVVDGRDRDDLLFRSSRRNGIL
jgi:hypothetical protein